MCNYLKSIYRKNYSSGLKLLFNLVIFLMNINIVTNTYLLSIPNLCCNGREQLDSVFLVRLYEILLLLRAYIKGVFVYYSCDYS